MIKFASNIALVATLLLFASCEKDIDIDYHTIEPLPVIEATLTQEGACVGITYTTPMDSPMDKTHLTDATVILTDLTAGTIQSLLPDTDGYFRNPTPGIVGHEYKLSVIIDNMEYQSFSQMSAATEIESAKFVWIRMPGDDMAVLQILFTDPLLTNDYYWIRIYRNGNPYIWSVASDRAAVDGIVEEAITTTHRDTEQEEDEKQIILDGDEVKVEISHISREMCDYLVALQNGNNGAYNFKGGDCLGYFLASEYAQSNIIYHPDDFEYAK